MAVISEISFLGSLEHRIPFTSLLLPKSMLSFYNTDLHIWPLNYACYYEAESRRNRTEFTYLS